MLFPVSQELLAKAKLPAGFREKRGIPLLRCEVPPSELGQIQECSEIALLFETLKRTHAQTGHSALSSPCSST